MKNLAQTRQVLIDLSHTIENGVITYKGLPAPVIEDFMSREESRQHYQEGTTFQIGKIEMVANTGTYIDCPFHRYAQGKDLSDYGLEYFTDLPAVVIHAPYAKGLALGPEHFQAVEVVNKAVLIHTGWDIHWNTEKYYSNHPYLTGEAAQYLAAQGARLVGIDSVNIDGTSGKERPVHSLLLEAEILIVEHLCNLEALPDVDFTFSAIPPKCKGMGSFPVRAMAKYHKSS